MKNFKSFLFVLTVLGAVVANAQNAETISLVQVPGKFDQTALTLKAGTSYVFEVANNGVDHKVGFVIAPKGSTDQANHVQSAYLKNAIEDGETAQSNEVVLEKGEYVYFCPLNPTPQYKIIVE